MSNHIFIILANGHTFLRVSSAKLTQIWHFYPKKDQLLTLKDLKGHFDQKYSFKGLFEIKDACTYTAIAYVSMLLWPVKASLR